MTTGECTECHLTEGHRMDCSQRPAPSFFSSLVRDPRDVQAPAGSINAELLALPQQREHTHDMKGRLLLLPRTGIIVVPFVMHAHSYGCVVVDGSNGPKHEDGEREVYPRGGHEIDVSDLEMQTAIELDPGEREKLARRKLAAVRSLRTQIAAPESKWIADDLDRILDGKEPDFR